MVVKKIFEPHDMGSCDMSIKNILIPCHLDVTFLFAYTLYKNMAILRT